MAKTKTQAVSGAPVEQPQSAVQHVVRVSESDTPAPQTARRPQREPGAFPPRRRRSASSQHPDPSQPRSHRTSSPPPQEAALPAATATVEAPQHTAGDADIPEPARPPVPPPSPSEGSTLTLHLSAALLRQLAAKAREEGISPTLLATELLAEGLVLRAWEILERQVTMRFGSGMKSQPSHYGPRGARPDNGGGHDRRGGHGNRRPPQQRPGSNVMDDQARFLEYVRTHDRKRR